MIKDYIQVIRGKKNRVISWLIKNEFMDTAFVKYGDKVDKKITWESGDNESLRLYMDK